MSEKLFPIAVLTQRAADRFEFRVRWLLGEGSDLPRPDDSFDVAIRLLAGDHYLGADGTFGAPGVVRKINVKPKPFAMIDPPRETVPYPADEARVWDVATKPSAPVDCSSGLVEKVTGGFGICHLLSETQHSRVQARVERLLATPVSSARTALSAKSGIAAFAADNAGVTATARELAEMLVRRAPRPVHLQQALQEEYSLLLETTAKLVRGERTALQETPALFGDGTLAEQWRRAALAFELFTDGGLIDELDSVIAPPSQVRQQVRLRALQGGRLIDYWCLPETPAPTCSDDARGRQYPASELIGTGFAIGDFSAADVQQWLGAAGGGGAVLEVKIEHIRALAAPLAMATDGVTVLDVFTANDGPLDPNTFPILATDLQLALTGGSSLPPPSPRGANVNFDFIQTNAGAEESVQLGYTTGEARVEIVITPGVATTFNKMVFGFNVYGMWEAPETKKFFDDSTLTPSADELRPWLITRKYSYERDLKGAFPKLGSVHPALKRALDDPPWQAVLLRVTEITDENERPNGPKLPNVFRVAADGTPQTRFALDLRVGMDSGLEGSTRKFVGWDPEAVIKLSWDPRKMRDGTEAVTRPQRYRFWVTAIDAFEQESAPVAVLTHDADAGEAEGCLFEPRFRASLLPPPAGAGRRTLELTKKASGAFRIAVKWETPFLNDMGRGDTGAQQRADKRDLLGAVKLFRRRLRRKIEQASTFALASLSAPLVTGDIFSLPQWIETMKGLTAEGWNECGSADAIQPPATGEAWQRAFDFDHGSRGFEYIALVGLRVRQDRAAFWVQDVVGDGETTGRRAFIAVKEGNDWKAQPGRMTETPRTTPAVPTEGWTEGGVAQAGALPVPNLAEPRGVALTVSAFHRARPILPPPGVARDLVLQRLLTRPVGVSKPDDPRPWADTEIPLTSAQAAMLEAALERTAVEAGIADPIHDPRLRDARLILGRELVSPGSDGKSYRQNLTIGFRGLVELQWRYSPFTVQAPREDEAEAEKVRIFSVRVPLEAKAAAHYATVRAKGTLSGGIYTLSGIAPEQQAGIETVEKFRQPALVRIETTAGDPPLFGTLTEIATTGGTTKIRVVLSDGTAPAEATISLYAAQPFADREIASFDAISDETMFLPVGGGHTERFAWWVQTLSAQEVVSGHSGARRPFFLLDGPPTTEPESPIDFAVNLPAASSAAFALDPTADRKWLPAAVATDHQAQHDPRTIVSWQAYDLAELVGIEIEREERLVEREAFRFAAFALDVTPWQAIKAIDQLADDALIDPRWVAAIRDNWLLGAVVDVPDLDASGTKAILIPASAERPLSGVAGVKLVASRPAFIDYFRNAGDDNSAMDGNYEYRYRICSWIDVLPDRPPHVDREFRFLRSRLTTWTDWILPEPGEASIRPDAGINLTLHDKDTPAVTFRFAASSSALRGLAAPGDGWFYRIVVKRLLDFSLPSTELTDLAPAWREVGAPLIVQASGSAVEVSDLLIERPEVDLPVSVSYRISARQLVVTPLGQERLVRTLDDEKITVTIPPPPDPAGRERMATKRVSIA
jgi:hypothetical protein